MESETYEMPVAMALIMAQTENAVSSFLNMPDERRRTYIGRARKSTSKKELEKVVRDIIVIG